MKKCKVCGADMPDERKSDICVNCEETHKIYEGLETRLIKKNMRGQAIWHTIAGIFNVCVALLLLVASIKGMEFKFSNFTYPTGAMWFSMVCWLLLACTNFIYASRLRQYADCGTLANITEVCLSASNIVVALIASPIAVVYGVVNFFIAKGVARNMR